MRNIKFNLRELVKSRDFIIGAAVLVVLVILLNNIYNNKTSQIKNLESRVDEENNKNEIYTQIVSLDSKIDKYAPYMIASAQTDRPLLLNQISAIAGKYGLRIESIDFEKDQRSDFYFFVPINLTLIGKFHDFGKFAGELESLERFFKITDLKIKSFFDEKSNSALQKFEVMVNAVIVEE